MTASRDLLSAERIVPEEGSTERSTSAPVQHANGDQSLLQQPRLLIRASAGTGKTFQLSSRYISILRFAPVEKILASTFTRKAAGEILERILQRLARASTNTAKLKELADSVDGNPLGQRECLQMLAVLTRQLHRVRISTLDGFFARLALTFALELGFPVNWRVLDEADVTSLQDAAITQMLSEGAPQELKQLMELLSKGQSSRSVHSLISSTVGTFYNLFRQAPAQAWEQFPQVHFLPRAERDQLIQQLAAIPMDDGRMRTARDKDCERLEAEDWENLVSSGLMSKFLEGQTTYYSRPIPPAALSLYARFEEHMRGVVIQPWASQTRATRDLLRHFDARFREQKRDAHGVQFDDITRALADYFLGNRPGQIAYRMDGGIEHLLLDEFQDTSPIQWNVLRPFADDVCRKSETSFFCVGDTKQAIYGWRGGEAAIFDAIERQLPGVVTKPLAKSFRSSPVIMETVNKAFRGMGCHDGLDDQSDVVYRWARDFPMHETALKIPGYAVLRTIPIPPDVPAETNNELKEIEYSYVARYVGELLQQTPQQTIGILVRNNATIGRIIYELNQAGIPASEEGGNPLTDSAAVQLVLSLLTLADHPGDTIARYHIARSRWGQQRGFTDFRDHAAADALAQQTRQALLQLGYGAVIHGWLHELAPYCNERELKRLRQLESLADAHNLNLTLRPSDFVEFVRTQKVLEPQEAAVRVMSIHLSKGLEFDSVILPELDKQLALTPPYYTLAPERLATPEFVALQRDRRSFQLLPESLRPAYTEGWNRQVEESLCVLYVAMTRAVHALHMLIRPRLDAAGEKHLPKTYAGLLRAGLARDVQPSPDTVLFETGERQWWKRLEPKGTEVPPTPQALAEPVRIQLAPIPPQRQRQLARITPSQEEGGRFVRLSHILPLGNAEALDRGSLFHAWFEQVKWLDEGKPTDEVLRRIAHDLGAQHLNIDRCLSQFHAMLRVPQIAWTLSRRSYQNAHELPVALRIQAELSTAPVELKVITERRFSVQCGDQLITGSIDRLVLISRNWQILAADILDFKTDSLPADPAAQQERIEFYRGQLESYVQAVAQIHQLDPERIAARLVLLGAGRVEAL